MRVELLTLSGTKFEGEALEVQLATPAGQIGILPHHEPLVAQVMAGPITVRTAKGGSEVFATFGGLIEVNGDRVRLLIDEADHADELVADEIEEALARAKDLRANAKDRQELAKAQGMIDRSQVRLSVANMSRSRRRER